MTITSYRPDELDRLHAGHHDVCVGCRWHSRGDEQTTCACGAAEVEDCPELPRDDK